MFDKRISFNLPRGYEYIEEKDDEGDISYKICYGISTDDEGEKHAEKTFTLRKVQSKGALVSNIDGNYPVQIAGFAKDFNIGLNVGSSSGYSSHSQIKYRIYSGLATIEYEDLYFIINTVSLGLDNYESRSKAAEELASGLTTVLSFITLDGNPLKVKPIPKSLMLKELNKESFELKTIDETPEEKTARLEKERVEREKRLEQERIEREKRLEEERREREARKKEEEERRKAEEERQKAEEERRRQEEEIRKIEEEKARKAAEEARAKALAERKAFDKKRQEARNNQNRVLTEKYTEIEDQRVKNLSERETEYNAQIEKITADYSGQASLLSVARQTLDAENELKKIQIEIDAEKKKAEALEESRETFPEPESPEDKERKLLLEERKRRIKEQEERDKIEQEALKRAEEERKETQKTAEEKRRKAKKRVLNAVCCILAVAAAALLVVKVVMPEMKYKNAVSLMENEDYDTAKTLFTELDGYKDSAEKIIEIDNALAYKKAEKALDNKEFDKAEEMFKDLGNFADSSDRVNEVIEARNADLYQQAEDLLARGLLDNAQAVFEKLGSYSDSSKRVEEVIEKRNSGIYQKAEAALEKNNFDQAEKLFKDLGDYSDASERVQDVVEARKAHTYEQASQYYEAGNYSKAKKLFKGLEKYKDASKKAANCQKKLNEALYAKAEKEYSDGDYEAAKKDFSSLGTYSDAKEMAKKAATALAEQEKEKRIRNTWSNPIYFPSSNGGFFVFEFEWAQGASRPSVYFNDDSGRHAFTIIEMTESKMVLSDPKGVTHTLAALSGSYNWQWRSDSGFYYY